MAQAGCMEPLSPEAPHCLSAWLSNLSLHGGTSNADNSNAGNKKSAKRNAGNSNVGDNIQLQSWIGT
ncbi:MAG: hypothetical protein FRX49_07849 [Trebouxia sp. A1-2]|nr:MAG: hypothetical protein FRX49_07849 [Trebouxia sp. A1-2]